MHRLSTIIFCIIASVFVIMSASEARVVYLSTSTLGNPWDGDCSNLPTTTCGPSSVCEYPNNVVVTDTTTPCEVVFTSNGSINGLTWTVEPTDFTLTLESDVDFLNAEFTISGTMKVQDGASTSVKSIISGSMTIKTGASIPALLTFADLHLRNMQVSYGSLVAATNVPCLFLTVQDCNITVPSAASMGGATFSLVDGHATTTIAIVQIQSATTNYIDMSSAHISRVLVKSLLTGNVGVMLQNMQSWPPMVPMLGKSLVASDGNGALTISSCSFATNMHYLMTTAGLGDISLDTASSLVSSTLTNAGSTTLTLKEVSTMIGFAISGTDIELTDGARIINGEVTVSGPSSKLFVTSGIAGIYLGQLVTPVPYANVIFQDTTIDIATDATLDFSPSSIDTAGFSYRLSGNTFITTSGSGPCYWNANSNVALAPATVLKTSCSTSLRNGLIGGGPTSRIEGQTASSTLSFDSSSGYHSFNASLDSFELITVHIEPAHAAAGIAVDGTDLHLYGVPRAIRIDWPSSGTAPLRDTYYELFVLDGVHSDPPMIAQQLITDPYDFDIAFLPSASTTLVVYKVSDSTPLPPIPSPSSPNSPAVPNAPQVNPSPSLNPLPPPPGAGSPSASPLAPSTPSPAGSGSPTSCPPPPPGFICSNSGTWVADTDVDTGNPFIIPPGVTVVVNGNFTASSDIIFQGNGHSLVVNGCLTLNNSQISIDFSQTTTWKTGTFNLIRQNGNCPTALNTLSVGVKQPKKGCKKVKSKVDSSSNRSTLNMLFTTDNSACNTKWIILGAVLGGVLVIGVIATTVIVHMIKKKKEEKSRSRLNG